MVSGFSVERGGKDFRVRHVFFVFATAAEETRTNERRTALAARVAAIGNITRSGQFIPANMYDYPFSCGLMGFLSLFLRLERRWFFLCCTHVSPRILGVCFYRYIIDQKGGKSEETLSLLIS